MFYEFANASLSVFPTLNFTTFVAGTLTTLSVPGTLASLSALNVVVNVPKPIKATLSPLFNASVIVSKAASTTF